MILGTQVIHAHTPFPFKAIHFNTVKHFFKLKSFPDSKKSFTLKLIS